MHQRRLKCIFFLSRTLRHAESETGTTKCHCSVFLWDKPSYRHLQCKNLCEWHVVYKKNWRNEMNSLRSNSKSLSTWAIHNLKSCDLRDFSVLTYDHALSLYLCNLFSEGGHDTILSQITCKKARIWTSFWLGRKQYGWFALFRVAEMPPSVCCCWFQSAFLLAQWAANTHASSLSNFCWLSFLEFEECLNRNFYPWNISSCDHVSRSAGLAKIILQGTVQRGKSRGRQKNGWENNIFDWQGWGFATP